MKVGFKFWRSVLIFGFFYWHFTCKSEPVKSPSTQQNSFGIATIVGGKIEFGNNLTSAALVALTKRDGLAGAIHISWSGSQKPILEPLGTILVKGPVEFAECGAIDATVYRCSNGDLEQVTTMFDHEPGLVSTVLGTGCYVIRMKVPGPKSGVQVLEKTIEIKVE